jgi:hypothetical protein
MKDTGSFVQAKTAAKRAALALLVGALLTGCAGPMGPARPEGSAVSGDGAGAGYGRVTITIGEVSGEGARTYWSERTLFPAASDFARFEISFSHPTASRGTLSLSPGVAQTVELPSGVWIITARAFTADAATAAAAGWVSVTVSAGGNVAERITLAPGDGTGTFRYAVAVPGGLSSAALTLTRAGLDGTDAAVDGGTLALAAGMNTGTIELPGGYYLLNIRLTSEASFPEAAGGLSAGRTELIHLYPGLTTEAAGPDYVFTDEDLALVREPEPEPPPATDPEPVPGSLSITVGLNLAHEVTLTGYSGDIRLSKTGANNTLTLNAEGYSAVAWYVDGEAVGAGGGITLNAADYDVRPHSLTFRGVREGVPYAKLIPFAVTAEAAYALAISVGAGASPAEIGAAIGAAVAALVGASPGPGQAWELRVNGLEVPDGLEALYAGAAAALPGGDIALDLRGCTGASIAYALSGTAAEQQAIRERFTALTLPASVTAISGGVKAVAVVKSALGGFSRLRQVSGSGVTTIGDNGLRDCAALETVAFPALETAGKEAFASCSSLAAANFPRAVSFGSYAFSGCTALGSLVLGDNAPAADLIFSGLVGQVITITVPAGRKAAYETAYSPAPWGGDCTVTIVER